VLSYGAFNESLEEANRTNKEVAADLMAQLTNAEDNHTKTKQQTETTDKIQKYVLKRLASEQEEKGKQIKQCSYNRHILELSGNE
jgi:maltose-binding protein MalE